MESYPSLMAVSMRKARLAGLARQVKAVFAKISGIPAPYNDMIARKRHRTGYIVLNIDLLVTAENEVGLVSDKGFGHNVAGVMFDMQSGQITLEFGDADPLELNIPVEIETGEGLYNIPVIHVGIIENGVIADSRQVPLVMLHDPFGGGNAGHFPVRPRSSVVAFESFMKRCIAGQPVHRADLGDESKTGTVLGGMSAAVLQFAPHLARQRAMEIAPQMHHAPKAPGLGPSGGGGGGGGRVMRRPPQQQSGGTDGEEQD